MNVVSAFSQLLPVSVKSSNAVPVSEEKQVIEASAKLPLVTY